MLDSSSPASRSRPAPLFLCLLIVTVAVLVLAPQPPSAHATTCSPQPRYGTAVVDGNDSEWDLTTSGPDFFANMYEGWNQNDKNRVTAWLYLRYDCSQQVMYVLVLANSTWGQIATGAQGGDSWVALGSESNKVVTQGSGNNGVPPDFAWVDLSGDGNFAAGWEASFSLSPGSYDILVHTSVWYNGEANTSGTEEKEIPLCISCPPGTIVVEKQTVPDGDLQPFTFAGDAAGTIGDGGQIVVSDLLPGTYNSTETVPAGWDLTSIVCNDTDSSGDVGTATATFDLDLGETVKCTFTDTKLGKIIVEKLTIPDGDLQLFAFTGDAFGFIKDGEQIVVSDLLPGTYNSTETVPVNWQLIDITCNDTNSVADLDAKKATFHLEAGEVVKCTFTDRDPSKLGTIVVEKQTIPADDPQLFTFTGTASGTIGDDGQIKVEGLVPGTYNSTETVPAGWKLVDIVCNDTSSANPSSGDVGTGKATFKLDLGEVVKCTFTDEKPSGPPPPPPVGGELYSVDKSALVQPYLGLLGLLGAVAAAVAITRRRGP